MNFLTNLIFVLNLLKTLMGFYVWRDHHGH